LGHEWRGPAGRIHAFGTASNVRRFRDMPIEFYFTPELHLKDGRIIRDLEDAASFAREHELRPGMDQRDEVLHKLERADSQETAHAAAHFFVRWAEELDLLVGTGRAGGFSTPPRPQQR
jgi:hypothetical protein